jgi:dCTP deaminase
MGVLCDYQIEQLAASGMIEPYEPSLINPASLDVRIGNTYRLATYLGWSGPVALGDGFRLTQGVHLLLDTLEYVKIPNYLMCEMWLKSSAGRKGLNVYKAGYIDPGFEGTVTFRLWNDLPAPVTIAPGDRVIQLVFREMSKVPRRSYKQTGHYNGQRGPTVAWNEGGER